MPRPPKPPAEVKDATVRVRFTKEQRELLEFAAKHQERELSDWLRRVALKEATRIKKRAAKREAKLRE
jgi:uncharacterized protein (DUF1778 family)